MTTRTTPMWREITTDTSADVEAVQFALFRAAPPWRKLSVLRHHSTAARRLAEVGVRQRHPSVSPTDLKVRLVEVLYGAQIAQKVYSFTPATGNTRHPITPNAETSIDMTQDDTLAVTLRVAQLLDALTIPYMIGGSLAGAVHGVVRATLDADIVADFELPHIQPFVEALQPDFYVNADAIESAIQHRTAFNLIHFATMFKLDIFVPQHRAFDVSQVGRRTATQVVESPPTYAYFATAEDMILVKLEWYRADGEVSERQWRDVLGIIKTQASLDVAYLREYALQLGVVDLLERALTETSP